VCQSDVPKHEFLGVGSNVFVTRQKPMWLVLNFVWR